MSDSDDDVPQLSAETLAALQEFYAERMNEAGHEQAVLTDKYTVGALEEDWRMSQFWYSEESATRLAEEAIQQVGEQGRIACVSAPSVHQKLKQLQSQREEGSHCVSSMLFEFDRRFEAYGEEFIFYDYNNPLCLPEHILPQSFDIVVADPPYLSEECLSKVALTVKYLTRSKILLCTGAIMEEHAAKLMGLKICRYLPKHNHNLANEFRCYINYESDLLS